MTDAQLLEAYSSREDESFGVAQGEAAFGELMRRHGTMVYRACHRLLKDPHEAEDASQAVFVVLARKAGGLRKGDLAAWLYRVAHLVAAETVRKRMHRAKREEAYAMEEAIQAEAFAASDVADPDLLGLVDAALMGLPERYREAVILRYLQNHSEAEAAQRAGCAVGTLSMRASRGIERLRQRLAKRGVALSGVALASLLTSEASAAVPETLLPSILATVKTAVATTAAATAATSTTSTAAMLAKGAMKAMYIARVKMVAAVAAVVIVTGTAVPVGIAVAQEVAQRKAAEQPPAAVAQSATSIKPVAAQPAVISDLPKTTDLEKKLKSIDIPGWHITEERLAIAVAKLVDAIATNDPQHARVTIELDPPTPSPRLQQFLSLTMDCRGERGREVTVTALGILEAMAEMSGQKIAFEKDRVVLSPKQPDKTTVVIPEISFKDAPVQEIISKLQTLSGVPIRLERTNDLPLITLQAKNIQLDLAVLTVASKAGLAMGYEKDVLGLVLK